MAGRKAAGNKPKIVRKAEAARPAQAPKAAASKAESKQEVKNQAPRLAAPAEEAPKSIVKSVEPIVTTVETGAETMTETITKAQEATKQAAQQATEQFRGAVNDANERGKVAMEKGARFVEEIADLTRGNVEAIVASSKTAAKYVETLTQGAADYSRRSFEEASSALRSFAEVKSPTDFFRLQSDYARGAFDSMVAESARVSETVVKMTGEIAQPITNRYAVAAERLKAVAA